MILNGKIININESPFFIDSLSLDFNDLLSFCAFVELHQKYPSLLMWQTVLIKSQRYFKEILLHTTTNSFPNPPLDLCFVSIESLTVYGLGEHLFVLIQNSSILLHVIQYNQHTILNELTLSRSSSIFGVAKDMTFLKTVFYFSRFL